VTSAGVLGIPIVGRLMDKAGFTATAVVTVTLAVIYGLGVLGSPSEGQLIAAFVAYALFRTFLFTYFFAYLADALGFKYFGILAGVAFFMAGLAGMLQSPLMDYASGDCHLAYPPSPGCDVGRWGIIHLLQVACLCALYLIPFLDFQDVKGQQQAQKSSSSSTATSSSSSRGGRVGSTPPSKRPGYTAVSV